MIWTHWNVMYAQVRTGNGIIPLKLLRSSVLVINTKTLAMMINVKTVIAIAWLVTIMNPLIVLLAQQLVTIRTMVTVIKLAMGLVIAVTDQVYINASHVYQATIYWITYVRHVQVFVHNVQELICNHNVHSVKEQQVSKRLLIWVALLDANAQMYIFIIPEHQHVKLALGLVKHALTQLPNA